MLEECIRQIFPAKECSLAVLTIWLFNWLAFSLETYSYLDGRYEHMNHGIVHGMFPSPPLVLSFHPTKQSLHSFEEILIENTVRCIQLVQSNPEQNWVCLFIWSQSGQQNVLAIHIFNRTKWVVAESVLPIPYLLERDWLIDLFYLFILI